MNHFQLIVIKRIADHKAAEEKRIEVERERLRAEEQAKAAQSVIPAPALEPAIGPIAGVAFSPPPVWENKRPTDELIIGVLMRHYSVTRDTVITWLLDMDIERPQQEETNPYLLHGDELERTARAGRNR